MNQAGEATCTRCGQPAQSHPQRASTASTTSTSQAPDRLALAVRVMKARRPSICTACRSPVLIGQKIARLINPDCWIHLGCVPIVRALHDDLGGSEDRRATPVRS